MRMKQTLNILKSKSIIPFLLVMSGILMLFSLYHINQLNQIVVLNDEFGYWSIAASMAGKNWTDLILNTPYYNYGYSIFLAPLFYLGVPTYLMYKIAIFFNSIMLVLGFLISFQCAKRVFSQTNEKVLVTVCFLVNCYSSLLLQTQVAWTETLLNLLFWIAFLNLILIIETPKMWNIITFPVVLSFMFITHQRTIGIVISGVIVLFLLYLSKKITINKLLISLVTLSGIIILHFFVKSEIKGLLWPNTALGNMNDFGSKATQLSSLLSISGLKYIFYGFAGRTFYFLVSCGLVWFLGIKCIISNIYSNLCKNNKKILEQIPIIEIFLILSFLSALGIDLIGISQGFGRADSVVYARYIENVIGPILLFGYCDIFDKKISYRSFISYTIILIASGLIVKHIYGLIGNHTFAYINCIGLARFFNGKTIFEAINYAIIYVVALNSIVFIIINSKLKRVGFYITGLFFLFYWLYMAEFVYANTIESLQMQKTDNNEEIVELLKKAKVDQIYYIKDEQLDTYCSNPKYLQYWVPDIQIKVKKYNNADTIPQNSIWICEKSSRFSQELIQDARILVENNEFYVCTQFDSQILTQLKNNDYSLEQFLDLRTADSEIWDDKNEGFQSNGNKGKLINNYLLNFSAGTYRIYFNIDALEKPESGIWGKCLITKFGGKEVLKEVLIDENFFNMNNNIIELSCMDTDDVEINIEVEKNVILNINSIGYEKITNDYIVGIDSEKDIKLLIDSIDSIKPEKIYYSSIHQGLKYDFSYLKSLSPDLTYKFIDESKLEKFALDGYLIIERKNVDIFDYLEKYDVIMVNGTYILLVSKDSGIAQTWIDSGRYLYSNNNFINTDILKLNSDGTMYSEDHVQLKQGTYELLIELDNSIRNIEICVDGNYEKIDMSTAKGSISKMISIKNGNQTISWKTNSVGGKQPKMEIRRIDKNYRIELPSKNKMVINSGEKKEIPLFDRLEMGTYEITFVFEDIKEKDININLYQKVDPINEFQIKTSDNEVKNEKSNNLSIVQRYVVDKKGYVSIKAVIKNVSDGPIKLKSIKFRTID